MTRVTMRYRLAALLLAVFACLALMSAPAQAEACRADTVHLKGDWGMARFRVEVVDTPETRARGLMHRRELASSAGMLFVYDHPRRVDFWMRNTLIPLDMIFVDSAGVVRKVHDSALPLDETPIHGGLDIQYVLEINGGLSRRLGIGPGTQLKHPAIAPDLAIWPCREISAD